MDFHEDKRKPDLIELEGAAIIAVIVLVLIGVTVWLSFF